METGMTDKRQGRHTEHLRTKIAAGYILIFLLVGGIVHLWVDEWRKLETFETENHRINALRMEVHDVYVRVVELSLLGETAQLFGAEVSTGELFTKLYQKSLEGETDCSGVLTYNYMAGEGVTHLDEGRPMVVRKPESKFTMANFLRSQLYATMATLKLGMDILAGEHVAIDSLTGHGGLFKTPVVGQKYMAAACHAPVTCMQSAGEGGPYGMALLASYMVQGKDGETLEDYLADEIFAGVRSTTLAPDPEDAAGFDRYLASYRSCLAAEKAAVAAF